MIMFETLVVAPYKGVSKARQMEIVRSLQGLQILPGTVRYDILASSLDEVKRIEAALKDKVPYGKRVLAEGA